MPAFSAIAWMGCMVAAWAISMSLGTGDLRTIELNASSFGLHYPARLDGRSRTLAGPGGVRHLARGFYCHSTKAVNFEHAWSGRTDGRRGRAVLRSRTAPASGGGRRRQEPLKRLRAADWAAS